MEVEGFLVGDFLGGSGKLLRIKPSDVDYHLKLYFTPTIKLNRSVE